jgi:5-formyltetrahydrofolate cyclo-ligase
MLVSMKKDQGLAAEKSALRKRCYVRRIAVPAKAAAAAAHVVASRLVAEIAIEPKSVVSAYWPLAGELDPRPALHELVGKGAATALPRVAGDGQPLSFHRWSEQDSLIEGSFNVMEPDPAKPRLTPTILLVPLLAFDRACRRLGHGKGYYDRTLANLRQHRPETLAIGVAFAVQQVDRVPTDAYDQTLDMIVTEQAIFRRMEPT